ncbi:hypothetical protein [Lutibacter sp.]|uniref:hypothetical protein n=1 Tax=Lutibacter sp. TaxID=1925666 RepID=UPI001A2F97EF|nr:hypothetical protein [Lutibacter sp.]MBI9042674.1 hypothetical protein [Lutibacter sp.]
MKLFLFFLLVTTSVYATGIEGIRNDFLNVTTIKEADNYIQLLEKSNLKQANAYKAAMLLMKAKFAFFPFNKWSYFKSGSELLDNSIANDPKNIEMRYVRFLFQSEIPKFLGYHKNIEEDYNLIITNIINSSLPLKFKKTMLIKMLLVKGIAAKQTLEINKIINKI